MPGCAIKYGTFMHSMWKAVARGEVPHDKAVFVQSGLRHGFRAGIDTTKMVGQRIFKNYKSALDGREAVTRATMKRVQAGVTVGTRLFCQRPELFPKDTTRPQMLQHRRGTGSS